MSLLSSRPMRYITRMFRIFAHVPTNSPPLFQLPAEFEFFQLTILREYTITKHSILLSRLARGLGLSLNLRKF